MRDDRVLTDADFERFLQEAIQEGSRFDTGLPENILDVFDLIFEADELAREQLIARARQLWEEAKAESPEDFTD